MHTYQDRRWLVNYMISVLLSLEIWRDSGSDCKKSDIKFLDRRVTGWVPSPQAQAET